MRFLVFATDVLPLPGVPTSGTALRTHGLIEGLRAHGHEVISFVPEMAYQGLLKGLDRTSLSPELRKKIGQLENFTFNPFNQRAIVQRMRPDVILCGHWPAVCFRTKPSQALIVDLAGPHLLERHYQKAENQKGATIGKLSALATADYFIVSGPSQRYYFLSFMFRAGVEDPAKRTVTIPMPLDPKQPDRTRAGGDGYPRFVFGGVFLPWQNPGWGLRQLVTRLEESRRGSLELIGGKHPNYPIEDGNYARLFSELSGSERVTLKPMLPYDEFLGELGRNDVALDLMEWNLERQLAITIRSTTYLWAGLPVIYNDFADLSKLIKKYDAGWCVRPGDDGALAAVLQEILSSEDLVRQKSENARALAAAEFSWDRSVEPLLDLLGGGKAPGVPELDVFFDIPQNPDLQIYEGGEITQDFLSRIDGLSNVECRIATHDRGATHPVVFSLFAIDDAGAAEKIAEEKIDPQGLINNEWAGIRFPPVRDSAGRRFRLSLRSSAPKSAAVSAWAAESTVYPMMELRHGGRVLRNAALCFLTRSTNTARHPLSSAALSAQAHANG